MAKILIHNSYSQLIDFSPTVMKAVAKKLTYKDEEVARQRMGIFLAMRRAAAYKKTRYIAILKDQLNQLGPEEVCMIDKEGIFPTGLIHLAKDALANAAFEEFDVRERPESNVNFLWRKKPHDMRYYQEEAVEAFRAAGYRGVIEQAVGTGKTLVATYIIKELGVNTLFIVPSAALLEQAEEVFTEAFGASKVQKLSTKLIKDKGKLKPIRIATVQTLASLHKQGLLEYATKDIDFLTIDEAHHAASSSFTKLLGSFKHIYYRLSLSGTYMRNDSKTLQLWGVSGKVVYSYSAAQATKDGFLTPAEFNIVKLGGRPDQNYQKEYPANYGSLEFLKAVADIVKKVDEDKSLLILVDRKDACGDKIHAFLEQLKIESTYVTGDSGKTETNKALKAFNDKKIRVLIGSTVFGEGIDIRSTDVLIMARGGKSEIAITQAIGRAIRLYPNKIKALIYDFNFRYTKYLSKHTDLRSDIYEKQFAGSVNWM